MADLTRAFDKPLHEWEQKLLEIIQTKWQLSGNIVVRTFAPLRLIMDNGEPLLPAIIVHLSPIKHYPIVGGLIPVADLVVWGVVPYQGTKAQRKALELMAARLTGILQQHFKVESYWSDIRLRETRILNSQEQPPRWEACQVRCEMWGLPISFHS